MKFIILLNLFRSLHDNKRSTIHAYHTCGFYSYQNPFPYCIPTCENPYLGYQLTVLLLPVTITGYDKCFTASPLRPLPVPQA